MSENVLDIIDQKKTIKQECSESTYVHPDSTGSYSNIKNQTVFHQ